MALSGTTSWTLQVDEIIDEALERIGGNPQTGNEQKSARRSLNLICKDWINRGILLWAVEEKSQTLTDGTSSYTLDSDTIDILDAIIRETNGTDITDITITRISREDYLEIPNKDDKARPSQWFLDRQRDAPVLYLYPTPNDSTDAFRYRRRRKIQDIDASYQDVDVPDRYLPSLTSGLAYYMSQKRPQIDVNRRQELKVQYEEEFERAITEDRERVDVRIIPDFGY